MLLYLSLIEKEEDKIKFEDIFNSYKKMMYYVAHSILKDEYYSHDAVQNSFLKIIKHIDKIEDVKCNKTKGFIVTIVKNSSIDIYRKLQMEKNKAQRLEKEIQCLENEVYDIDILPNKVEVAILKLPERYKQVFFLKYSHGFQDDEIADMLDISPSTVRTRIKRGKDKLKIILDEMEKVHG
ncbi:RNA polymerase sigma factor [Romboutsia weinsteinii]|uniref:RNA polymerase sigma factor n=1 Tax=Romboutsia weinsteinii TaxID=2020949 RepID=A0A371J8M3_9FIRM|nr:RNA polymerase sigma factor [Romboutsia weinsteinii]RDY29122.1 RNA polymerase sigma factor [Romboutsia weinsteinii]